MGQTLCFQFLLMFLLGFFQSLVSHCLPQPQFLFVFLLRFFKYSVSFFLLFLQQLLAFLFRHNKDGQYKKGSDKHDNFNCFSDRLFSCFFSFFLLFLVHVCLEYVFKLRDQRFSLSLRFFVVSQKTYTFICFFLISKIVIIDKQIFRGLYLKKHIILVFKYRY